jgi:hypothetical protein
MSLVRRKKPQHEEAGASTHVGSQWCRPNHPTRRHRQKCSSPFVANLREIRVNIPTLCIPANLSWSVGLPTKKPRAGRAMRQHHNCRRADRPGFFDVAVARVPFVVSLLKFGRTLPRRLRIKPANYKPDSASYYKGAVMTDDSEIKEVSSSAANGAIGDSGSAISVRSNGGAKAIDGADEKALSTVSLLIAEINRLAEDISIRSGDGAKTIDGLDKKTPSIVTFLIAEINRLAEENQQLKRLKDKYHDVEKRLALLKETIRPFRTNEFLSSVCLITGSAGLGAAPSFLKLDSYGYIFMGISAVLLISGIAARVGGPPGLSSK